MSTVCAVYRLSDGLIINMVIASPSDPAPVDCALALVADGVPCNTSWYYDQGTFHGPKTYAVCTQSTDEIVAFNIVSYVASPPVPPMGHYIIEVPSGMLCAYGWTWDGTHFSPPTA